jgi:CoA-transferase family III
VGSAFLWRRLCEAIDLDPDEHRFATNDDRVRNREALTAVLESSFANTDTHELLEEMSQAGIPAGRVRSFDDVYASDQVASQGLALRVDHPRLGTVTLPGPPLRFFDDKQTRCRGRGTTRLLCWAPTVTASAGGCRRPRKSRAHDHPRLRREGCRVRVESWTSPSDLPHVPSVTWTFPQVRGLLLVGDTGFEPVLTDLAVRGMVCKNGL